MRKLKTRVNVLQKGTYRTRDGQRVEILDIYQLDPDVPESQVVGHTNDWWYSLSGRLGSCEGLRGKLPSDLVEFIV